ncbi:hypothetical protein [Nonomuraea sp. B19D2]|uniref:hypothetical protein n=1 Tax=Nonomuraea sp. B19D2 TaxID=3159561 RepID=UPI0032DB4B51
MPQERWAPGVALLCGGSHRVLVDVDAETGSAGAFDVTVHEPEHLRVHEVVEQLAAAAVLDAQGVNDFRIRYESL